MILIAQAGTQFQDIQYLTNQEFLAYDLEELTITPIEGPEALKQFLIDNKARVLQEEILGLELLRLPVVPSGYAEILNQGTHTAKDGRYSAKWTLNDSQLSVKVGIDDLLIPYKIICNRTIYGYSLDFVLNNRKLVSQLPCKMPSELAKPLDKGIIFVSEVINKDNLELYTVNIDVRGASFTTIFVKARSKIYFADLELRKFVAFSDLF